MRHKQRPVKSSRHKSVTFIIDSHTSFGDQNNTDSQLQQAAKHQQQQHLKSSSFHQPVSFLSPGKQQRTSQPPRFTSNPSHNHFHGGDGGQSSASSSQQAMFQTTRRQATRRPIIGSDNGDDGHFEEEEEEEEEEGQDINNTTTSTSNNELLNNPLMRKQFVHNYRHMSDVMRLAFLENNDISIDDCSNIDFNSLSTASILHRNIQQQLQQERRDQLQMRQQQHSHLHNQQQHHDRHYHHNDNHHHHNSTNHQLDHQEILSLQHDPLDEYGSGGGGNNQDDNMSYCSIFQTATQPNSSSSTVLDRTSALINAAQEVMQQFPGVSGPNTSNRRSSGNSPNSGSKKRTRESMPRVEFSNHVQVETIQNYGEGFLCDEPGCGKSFPSLRKLRHHKVVHSDDFPFVCEFNGCAKKFKRKFGIDLHSTTHFDLDPDMYTKTSNNSSLPFFGRRMQYSMCKPCGQKFKTVHEYQYHMLKHGKEPFKCPVKGCGQTFGIWKSFQKHRASHYFNYYCKMDPSCDHHTSNLQLLKLHIYCCHFRRKLPENATLASKDTVEEEPKGDEPIEVVENEEQSQKTSRIEEDRQDEEQDDEEPSLSIVEDSPKPIDSTPRRDSRLRKNPPRSSTFGQQDYASINNGSSFVKSLTTSPQTKRTRSAIKQQQQQEQQNQQEEHYDQGVDDYASADDYEISDSGIFATATPISSTTSTNRNTITSSTPKGPTQNVDSFNGKKRTKESLPRVVIQSPVKEEVVHNYGEGFLCDEPGCGKSFPSLRKLRHHKVVHSDDFPFVCEFNGCAKKFKRKFGIDLHSTTHFDLDPDMYSKTSNNSSLPFFGRRMQYSMCKPCGQKFKTVHEYQYHMLKHGKEPFKCPVKGCGQTFGIWKSFQKHRASHYFNYYCKMDPSCDHHTSNLQLLKLHIYCCHFRRKLPENATLSSKDQTEEQPSREDSLDDVVDDEEQSQQLIQPKEEPEQESSISLDDTPQKSTDSTPRRDSRLRKNPPRSSTFGQQDYASINNGSSFAKSIPSTPTLKRSRTTLSSSGSQTSAGSQSVPVPEKKLKLPLKVLPKRSAQRLPMSLIADDASTEDEAHTSEDESSFQHDRDDDDNEQDPSKRNKFKCHLCDYKFSVRFQLTKHLSTHLELTPEMYSANADKQVVQLSERRRREFYCDKCNIKFEQMVELDNHMRKHGQRPYVCNFCQHPSTFRLAKQYLSHLYEHRFNYKCTMSPDCDFTINRKDALKLHIFRMHLDQQLPHYIENFANFV